MCDIIRRICVRVIEVRELELYNVPDHLKMQKMCNEAVKKGVWQLYNVSDRLETTEMCQTLSNVIRGA